MATTVQTGNIFKSKNGFVSYRDFINAYDQLGINEGSVLFLHTQFFAFGKLISQVNVSQQMVLNQFVQDIKDRIGEKGTLMMTTFSLDPLKTGVFDTLKTPSGGGVLTEFFRKMKDVYRSSHPTHSFALWGNDIGFKVIDNSTFGDGSIYGKLYHENATLIFWGAGFYYCTFNHFIEETAKVPYRRKTPKKIKIIENGREYVQEIITYSKSDRFKIDFTRFENLLLKKGLLKSVTVGDGQIMSIKATDLFNEGVEALKKDKYFFLKKENLISYRIRKFKAFIKSLLKS